MTQFITDFGDQAVLLPLAALIALAWLAAGWKNGTLAWTLAIGATLFTMLMLKLTVMGCGVGHALGLHSPSGHTAGAAIVYGGFAALLLRRKLALAPAVLLGALPPALLIGLTRVELEVHTPADIAIGALVGITGACALVAAAGAAPPTPVRAHRLLLLAIPAVLLLHGHRAEAEPRILWLAHHLWPFSTCR